MPVRIYLHVHKDNPAGYGPVGWACLIEQEGKSHYISGNTITSGPKGGLLAAIKALKTVKGTGQDIIVNTTDSYLAIVLKYCPRWKGNDWIIPSSGNAAANIELLDQLVPLIMRHGFIRIHPNKPSKSLIKTAKKERDRIKTSQPYKSFPKERTRQGSLFLR